MSSSEPARARVFVPDPRLARPRRFEAAAPAAAAGAEPVAPPAPEPDLEQVRADAFEAGRRAGREELPWREAEALQAAVASVEEAARALAALHAGYLARNRRAAVELAVAIAEKILGREVAGDPDALASLLERAIARLADEPPLRVHLCAAALETLEAGAAPALARLRDECGLEWVADPELGPGDARVEGARARVDARLRALLDRVRDEVLGGHEPEEHGA